MIEDLDVFSLIRDKHTQMCQAVLRERMVSTGQKKEALNYASNAHEFVKILVYRLEAASHAAMTATEAARDGDVISAEKWMLEVKSQVFGPKADEGYLQKSGVDNK